ncbi:unnamed protein product [Adineta steineri]|uniref:Uncharacterized protein n=1 Tax=Adineta steineri TaxID=433720 RepID=A0A814RWE3_9BILA|nr:unnamed protein product [Adineta steineri]CAF1434673.1 unnamed protein product [Adineta steineri]
MFTNLIYVHFGLNDDFLYAPTSLIDFLYTTYYASNIVHLNVRVRSFDDCLCLLDRRFTQLHTFIVQVDRIYHTSMIIKNTETLSNLKCFSLTLFWATLEYDNLILPLLHQMSFLEKLTLSFTIRDRISFIDGNHLVIDIISKKPYLHTFIFDIVTNCAIADEQLLPTSDDVRCPLIQRGYNVGYYIDYLYDSIGRCHIYSLPFTMERIQDITIKFPGGVFTHVRHLVVHDFFRSIEHDFFLLISQAFPLLKHMTVVSLMEQKKKQSNKSDEYEETSSIIKYSHLTTLKLSQAHIDYAKELLLDSNTRLPCLNKLYIDYEKLANVTEDFTSDAAHVNCAKLKNLILYGSTNINETNFFNYFPFVQCRFRS